MSREETIENLLFNVCSVQFWFITLYQRGEKSGVDDCHLFQRVSVSTDRYRSGIPILATAVKTIRRKSQGKTWGARYEYQVLSVGPCPQITRGNKWCTRIRLWKGKVFMFFCCWSPRYHCWRSDISRHFRAKKTLIELKSRQTSVEGSVEVPQVKTLFGKFEELGPLTQEIHHHLRIPNQKLQVSSYMAGVSGCWSTLFVCCGRTCQDIILTVKVKLWGPHWHWSWPGLATVISRWDRH